MQAKEYFVEILADIAVELTLHVQFVRREINAPKARLYTHAAVALADVVGRARQRDPRAAANAGGDETGRFRRH
jgi:hypothetical protein